MPQGDNEEKKLELLHAMHQQNLAMQLHQQQELEMLQQQQVRFYFQSTT